MSSRRKVSTVKVKKDVISRTDEAMDQNTTGRRGEGILFVCKYDDTDTVKKNEVRER